jgi:hypothetical protein
MKQKTKGDTKSRRSKSLFYYLTLSGEKVPVCKTFFMNTLGTTERSMRTCMAKSMDTGVIQKEKRGGRYESMKVRDTAITTSIVTHIQKFPRVESHYCRESSTREYLSEDLNLNKMYALYEEDKSLGQVKGKITKYRSILKEMNLSFHHPKKDQCSLCMAHKKGDPEMKQKLEPRYNAHIARKKHIRQLKSNVKEEAKKANSTTACLVFDLQKVLTITITKESAVFYKRRLSVYYFTVYNIETKECLCYTWHEGQSKRGSNEIATCVYMALRELPIGKEKIVLYSDGCSGQNKNSIMPAMLMYFVKQNPHIKEVCLRFFDPYHGQSEGDSVHSAIRTAIAQAGDIFLPSQLATIFSLARRGNPYKVRELESSDFKNFQDLSQKLMLLTLRKFDNSNEQINWTKITEVMVKQDKQLNKIYFKNDPMQDNYKSITLKRNSNKFLAREPKPSNVNPQTINILKYNDLQKLCEGDPPVIRSSEHKQFYKNLPHSA